MTPAAHTSSSRVPFISFGQIQQSRDRLLANVKHCSIVERLLPCDLLGRAPLANPVVAPLVPPLPILDVSVTQPSRTSNDTRNGPDRPPTAVTVEEQHKKGMHEERRPLAEPLSRFEEHDEHSQYVVRKKDGPSMVEAFGTKARVPIERLATSTELLDV